MATANARIVGIISTVESTYICVKPAMPYVVKSPPITEMIGATTPRRERVINSITTMQISVAIIISCPISLLIYTVLQWVTYGIPVPFGCRDAYSGFLMMRSTSSPVMMSGATVLVFFQTLSFGKALSFTIIHERSPFGDISFRAT